MTSDREQIRPRGEAGAAISLPCLADTAVAAPTKASSSCAAAAWRRASLLHTGGTAARLAYAASFAGPPANRDRPPTSAEIFNTLSQQRT